MAAGGNAQLPGAAIGRRPAGAGPIKLLRPCRSSSRRQSQGILVEAGAERWRAAQQRCKLLAAISVASEKHSAGQAKQPRPLQTRLAPPDRHQPLFRLLEFLRPFGDGLRFAGRFNVAEPHGL
jgi:hypothetical protein